MERIVEIDSPSSPGHCLKILNEHMRTDLLRSLHARLEEGRDGSPGSPPLDSLIESIKWTLASVPRPDNGDSVEVNPLNLDAVIHGVSTDDQTHDIKLLAKHLLYLEKLKRS
jgi:hypothetical protein